MFGTLFSLAVATLLASCGDDSDNGGAKPEEENNDYTIMLYGCGGGNLDGFLMLNLEEAAIIGSTDKVKMTAQVKFSKAYQNDPEISGTRRFIVGTDEREQEEVMPASLPLYEPATLAEFIEWSKAKCPASRYILIMWNHGGGWLPDDDRPLESRAALYDDNVGNRAMSIYELTEGIKQSNTKFEMIYFDACLMNMLENLGELTDVCNYTLAAGHVTPGYGGEYSILMTLLEQESDFVGAIRKYGRAVMNHWIGASSDGETDYGYDLTMTDMSKLPAVFDIVRDLTDELVSTYEEYEEEYDAVEKEDCYFYDDDFPFVDIDSYIEMLALSSGNPRLFNIGSRFTLAADEAIVYQTKNQFAPDEMTWSVTLVNKAQWAHLYEPYSTSYGGLKFEQSTGWSRWLKMNNITSAPIGPGHDH